MRIQSDGVIVGQPALVIRKLLQQERGTIATIAESLEVDSSMARQIYHDLSSEGYIEPSEWPLEVADERWQTTRKGNALANATARKPITRRTAERLLEEFLNRVKQINACDDYVYRVKQVILFGSYLSDSPRLGDVDLSIVLEFRENDPHQRGKRMQERIKHTLREGKTFRNSTDQALWPQLEIFSVLKGRSPSISVHDEQLEQVLSQAIPSKILFDATRDKS